LLQEWGIRGVVLDVDNTIVPWHTTNLVPGVQEWVERLRRAGVRTCLVTNNYGAHVHDIAQALDVPLVLAALKPLPGAFWRSLRTLRLEPRRCVAVGDQLFADVLGAKLVGMKAIVVRPVSAREFATTRVLRVLERLVYPRIRNGLPPPNDPRADARRGTRGAKE
jgi:HAD superfamily phosphatase (TIGR01668 family)